MLCVTNPLSPAANKYAKNHLPIIMTKTTTPELICVKDH